MKAHEKAAGVLDTPEAASETHHESILCTRVADRKEYSTLQAEFALLGIVLSRSHRAHDGHICYAATRNGQSRYFTHLHDLQAHYTAALAAKFAALERVRRPTTHKKTPDDDHLD